MRRSQGRVCELQRAFLLLLLRFSGSSDILCIYLEYLHPSFLPQFSQLGIYIFCSLLKHALGYHDLQYQRVEFQRSLKWKIRISNIYSAFDKCSEHFACVGEQKSLRLASLVGKEALEVLLTQIILQTLEFHYTNLVGLSKWNWHFGNSS